MDKRIVRIEATEEQIAALSALGLEPIEQNVIAVMPHDDDPSMVRTTMTDGAQDQAIEPENVDKFEAPNPFVRAQISTKNQMILRNVLAAMSSIAVVIVFILEKLGVL